MFLMNKWRTIPARKYVSQTPITCFFRRREKNQPERENCGFTSFKGISVSALTGSPRYAQSPRGRKSLRSLSPQGLVWKWPWVGRKDETWKGWALRSTRDCGGGGWLYTDLNICFWKCVPLSERIAEVMDLFSSIALFFLPPVCKAVHY